MRNNLLVKASAIIMVMALTGCGADIFTNKTVNEESEIAVTEDITTTVVEAEEEVKEEAEEVKEEVKEEVEEETAEITEEIDEEMIALVGQMLDVQGWSGDKFFQGQTNADYFLYSDSFEEGVGVLNATMTNLVSEECIDLENECRFENSFFILEADYLETLQPSYYQLIVDIEDHRGNILMTLGSTFRVCSEKDPFEESEYALATNYLDYHYEEYDTLHITVDMNTRAKITGFYTEDGMLIDEDQYRILYDGRAAELSATFLEQCKTQYRTIFKVEFDNGEREDLTIANPYIQ